MAKAFAKSSELNFAIMRQVRSKWVGESERNLSQVFDLAKSLQPVLIFVDEADQALGRRGGYSGDSGTSERIFARILEEMADNRNRGRILWVCASNRPDYLDSALLSRFDMVIPFFLPNDAERLLILAALLERVCGIGPEQSEELGLEELAEKLKGYSGREMETIVRRAQFLATRDERMEQRHLLEAFYDFLPNRVEEEFRRQSYLAAWAANSRAFFPGSPPPLLESVYRNGEVDAQLLAKGDLYRAAVDGQGFEAR
jgi:SpoVK/Ycf46/Vps4 family AAA+-type ATPase